MKVGKFLKAEFARRRSKNSRYSGRGFARDLGISQSLYSQIVRRDRPVSTRTAIKLLQNTFLTGRLPGATTHDIGNPEIADLYPAIHPSAQLLPDVTPALLAIRCLIEEINALAVLPKSRRPLRIEVTGHPGDLELEQGVILRLYATP